MERNKSIRNLLLPIVMLLLGLIIAHLGVALFIQANLGSDPYNVFVQGTFRTLQQIFGVTYLTHGYTHVIISMLIILVLLFIDRSFIKIGTIFCMLLGGPIIDLFTYLLKNYINESLPFFMRILVLMVGCVILAFGMTIVIKSEAGTGPNDLIAIVISDKMNKKFSVIRILVDFLFVTTGWLMGGIVGLGTVICAFMVGPVAGVFLPYSEKMIKRIYHQYMH